jgi:hypothetical protein
MKYLNILGLVFFVTAGAVAQTQIDPTPAKTTDRDGKIIVSDPQATDVGIRTTTDRQKLSQQVKDLLQRFEGTRDAYLKEQEELRRKQRGAATESERELVRAQIKEARDAWLERSRVLREELKDRIAELRPLMPQRSEILDNALPRSPTGTLIPETVHHKRGRE